MNKKSTLLALACLAAILSVSGCVASIGNGNPPRSNATVGQQLIDLKRAHEAGALSDAEYDSQRSKLLNGK